MHPATQLGGAAPINGKTPRPDLTKLAMTPQTNIQKDLRKQLVSQALKNPLFHELVSEAATSISNDSGTAENEATIEFIFEREIYSCLKEIGVPFKPVKESALTLRRHTAKGRADSRLNQLVIEYKQPSTLRTKKQQKLAEEQLILYLEAIVSAETPRAVGYVTDGTKLARVEIWHSEDKLCGPYESLKQSTLFKLISDVLSLDQKALTPQNLISDFCSSEHNGALFNLARKMLEAISYHASLKTEMLRTEWEALFRLSHDDKNQQKKIEDRRKALEGIFSLSIEDPTLEYQAIFSLHTAYAVVLKLIAYRVVCDIELAGVLQDFKSVGTADDHHLRTFCASLEDGEIFRDLGLLNLLEGDFFAWYCDADQWRADVADEIRTCASILARYEDAANIFSSNKAIDLFRDLYEATVPQAIRSSFGEFYTPAWLADHMLQEIGVDSSSSILDPCCGSGTFLVTAIERVRAAVGQDQITASQILNRVYGIDLNPLAVLTARINYFIHISDLISTIDEPIVFPVFLADSSNIPNRISEDGYEYLHYELATFKTPIDIRVPSEIANDRAKMFHAMYEFESCLRNQDFDEGRKILVKLVEETGLTHTQAYDDINSLVTQLSELEIKQWNGIWARIISNFVSVAAMEPFDMIIGNPPWIDWKSLPSGYREKIKALCIDRGLFSGAGRTGGINLNICALITHVCASNWLKKNGHLAFLMPKELLNQPSYEGWRNTVGGDSFSLLRVFDWSRAGHPFDPVKEDFLTYIFKKTKSTSKKVKVIGFEKTSRSAKAKHWKSFQEAKLNLASHTRVAAQLSENSSAYTIAENNSDLDKFKLVAGTCHYIGREGLEFYPQELMLFHYVRKGPKNGTVLVKNFQGRKSKYQVPSQKIILESKFLFPLAKGPGIERFSYIDPDLYVLFPYVKLDPHAPIPPEKLRKEAPYTFMFLKKFQHLFEAQTGYSDTIKRDETFYGVARTGPYSFHKYYVAFRDNSKWRATVMTKKTCPWGGQKRFVFQNHAVSICERQDRSFISYEEALYVAGILNTPIVEKYILAASDSRSFRIRPPVFVPVYDPSSKLFKEISRLAGLALNAPADQIEQLQKKIEEKYLKLARSKVHD